MFNFLYLLCCVGSGVCDELITCSEESYKVCCCVVYVCVLFRNLNDSARAKVGLVRHGDTNVKQLRKLDSRFFHWKHRFAICQKLEPQRPTRS